MKKTTVFFLLAFLTLHTFAAVPTAQAVQSLTAPSALLWDPATNKILYSRAPHRRRSPASTAKIMTAIVVLDSLSLDHWVTISSRVEGTEPTKLYLKSGDRFRVRDLLKATLMKSANDAARALAIEVAGSEWAFAQKMTQKAKQLGAKNTLFANASGLPAENQYSTAYDLAVMMREAMKYEFMVSTMKQKNATIVSGAGKKYYLKSHNKMLWRSQKVVGKTGWTRSSKYCFVGFITSGSHSQAIVSVLGSRKLWIDLSSLIGQVTGVKKNSRILSYGSRGKEVKQLQNALKQLGYFKGEVTGFYGPITKRAVARFQRAQGMRADGIVGLKTKEALAAYL